jgi:hypothetical protein
VDARSTSEANRRSRLGVAVFVLYIATFLGVVTAVVSVTQLEASNSIKFVFSAIALMLSALCFSVGRFIDAQWP